MRRWRASTGVLIGCLLALTGSAHAQNVVITSKAAEINIGGRVQMQARTSSCSAFPVEPDCQRQVINLDWFVRRARLEFGIIFDDFIEGKISPEFAANSSTLSETTVKDAYGQLNFSRGAKLRLGQFKRPFDGFQLTSSTQIRTIERDIDIPGVSSLDAVSLDELIEKFHLSDRNVGIQLNGKTESGRFEYWIATFNGNSGSDNSGDSDGKQFIGRGQVTLNAGNLPVKLAIAGAVTDAPFTNASGALDGEYYANLEIYAEIGDFGTGPHLQAEFFYGDNPLQDVSGAALDLASGDEFATARALQFVASFKLPVHGSRVFEAIEPVFRLSYADPNNDVDSDEAWGLTPGIQLFLTSRQKIALNWDFLLRPDGQRNLNSFKGQYQFYF